jgi:2-methylcitrate dehydratase PrpD
MANRSHDSTETCRDLARFVRAVTYDDLTERFRDVAVRGFVDTVGLALAGTAERGGELTTGTLTDLAGDAGDAPVFGSAETLSLTDAVCANCTAAHQHDYDDTSLVTHNHPSAPVVPTVLTLAGTQSLSGREALTAYAVGVETQYALAERMDTDAHVGRGWHATPTLGTFGAAAATCWLRSHGVEETAHALRAAASMPAGLQANFGTMTKPLHVGHAARSGVTAALLAERGFTGSEDALDGAAGFFEVYADGRTGGDADVLADAWRVLDDGTYHLKKYPCCSSSHPALGALERLGTDHDLSPDTVEGVRVAAPGWTRDELQYPDPDTPLESKFSMEHAVASALVDGPPGEDAFSESALADETVAEMREVVDYEADPTVSYGEYTTTAEVDLADGRTLTETVSDPPGSHSNPLTDVELRAKFVGMAGPVVGEATAESLSDDLRSLTDLPDLDGVVATLTG